MASRDHADIKRPLKILEVGAGRGSLGAHFASSGHDVTLLDISPKAIELARSAFQAYGLEANYIVADCEDIPFPSDSFDLVCSVGLLEHFADPAVTISEQFRVLKHNGFLCSYVVPDHVPEVQARHNWVNNLLAALSSTKDNLDDESEGSKEPVFRTDYLHDFYRLVYETVGFRQVSHDWVYPMPMISHSVSFPFSILEPAAEQVLLEYLHSFATDGIAGWACPDFEGQAFFVNGNKS